LIIVIVILVSIFVIPWALTERGNVIGEFVKGGHRGYGDECGQYPFTFVRLKNYSIDGNIYDYDYNSKSGMTSFYFGNQYKDVDNLIVGNRYKFNYHKESRSSDVSAGDMIDYYVLDSIETL